MSDLRRENFGGNIRYAASARYEPASEEELLEILRRHRGQEILAIGRGHCWSRLVEIGGVQIDLRRMKSVEVHAEGDSPWAEVGAGCQIKRLLLELRRQGGFTALSQGLIKEQALAGAASTGTHGSGKHCLSQYIDAVRIARFDPITGEPRIDEIRGGPELAAARCSLGCLGIITRVRIPIRRAYQVEEHFHRYNTIAEVIAAEEDFPLQQSYFVPWRWDFFAQHRREVPDEPSWDVIFYRLYWAIGMDVMLHLVIIALTRWLPAFCTRFFFSAIVPMLVPQNWKVVDRSDVQLSMGHELFRHIETEVFVTAPQLPAALDFVRLILQHAGGDAVELPAEIERTLAERGLLGQWQAARGCFTHCYPICIRKVLADDTLVSMASGEETRYAISFISYAEPKARAGFYEFASLLVRTMAALFQARPHWGKHCPLEAAEHVLLYPNWPEFAAIARRSDPEGHFANPWLHERLTLGDWPG